MLEKVFVRINMKLIWKTLKIFIIVTCTHYALTTNLFMKDMQSLDNIVRIFHVHSKIPGPKPSLQNLILQVVVCEVLAYIRSSHPEVFLGKGDLEICSKFTGEHPLLHGCSPVNLLHIFRTHFLKNISGWLLLPTYWEYTNISTRI